MEPFAVIAPGDGQEFAHLGKVGLRVFKFLGSGVATINFPRGFIGEEFAYIPLTAFAVTEEIARSQALLKLAKMAPGYRWSVSPAPHGNEDRKSGRSRK